MEKGVEESERDMTIEAGSGVLICCIAGFEDRGHQPWNVGGF